MSGIPEFGMHLGAPADVLVLRIPHPYYWRLGREFRLILRDGYNLLRLAVLCSGGGFRSCTAIV